MEYKSEKQKLALQKQVRYLQELNKLFTLDQEKEIIELYKSGLSCNKIAKNFNCSKTPILRIIKNLPKRKPGEYSNHYSKTQGFGPDHHSWKGGYKSVYDRVRDLKSYWDWRYSVLNRDNNKCTKCNSTEKLHAHHINTLKKLITKYCETNNKLVANLTENDLNNNFFYNLDNGLTLCEPCHKDWHKVNGR